MIEFEQDVSPLRIANEAFMVAATIERCPRSMMLRELVMNALEAAFEAQDGGKRVRIDAVQIDGVQKLRIWNTGRGLASDELLKITDLSSSLFKTVGLEGNFGMGAKAASLTSNRHGLRYRSCRGGRVSEITLGQRGGIYGRLRRRDADGTVREVVDVTDACRAEGELRDHDWTEVVLLGNAADQNTVRDPYSGDPRVSENWVTEALGKRFVHLPEGVELTVAAGTTSPAVFDPPLGSSYFDRVEEVQVGDGITIHYAYRAEESIRPQPPVPTIGLGAVVYGDEVYALADGRRWLLEAPTYGFTFAARRVTVLVELPRSYDVRPEQYRQFLRFSEGEQRQVQLADFGEIVRENIPGWLKRIIDAMRPQNEDYLAEINSDLEALLMELGVEHRAWQKRPPLEPMAFDPDRIPSPPSPVTEPPPRFVPPEILVLDDEEQIAEKALSGRAARYVPDRRQLFINARYKPFMQLSTRLCDEYAASADHETLKILARQATEWALVQRVARTLIHSLAKSGAGWSDDEVKAVQSPEAMTLVVDDVEAELPLARRRLAYLLGIEGDTGWSRGTGRTSEAEREVEALAEAEARLQRAISASVPRLGPFYQQIGNLLARRRDFSGARAFLDKGIAADPNDPWCRFELAGVLLGANDLEGAAAAAEAAFERAGDNTVPFWRRRIEVATRRGDVATAEAFAHEALAEHPTDCGLHFDLSTLHLSAGDLEAAAHAAEQAKSLGADPSGIERRLATIARRRGRSDEARGLLSAVVARNPSDTGARLDLARLLITEREFDTAAGLIDEALAADFSPRAALLRGRCEVEAARGNHVGALAAIMSAIEADPTDSGLHQQHAAVLLAAGDLDAAGNVLDQTIKRFPDAAGTLRLRAVVARRQSDVAGAAQWLDRALAANPRDVWAWFERSALKLADGDFDAADAAAAEAFRLAGNQPVPFLRRRSEIAFRRGDSDAARRFLEAAMAADPTDPSPRMEASAQFLAAGETDAALAMVEAAMALVPQPTTSMLRRGFEIEMRRGNTETARGWIERIIASDPANPQPWTDLARILVRTGDLVGAQRAAERALELSMSAPLAEAS